jgi:hypothetical protein
MWYLRREINESMFNKNLYVDFFIIYMLLIILEIMTGKINK